MLYKVVIEADPLKEHTAEQVRRKLAHLFKTKTEKVERFFQGAPELLKSGLDLSTARKYQQAIARCGASAVILPQRTNEIMPPPKKQHDASTPDEASKSLQEESPVPVKGLEKRMESAAADDYIPAPRRLRINAGLYTLLWGMMIFSVISFGAVSYFYWSTATRLGNAQTQARFEILSSFYDKQGSAYVAVFLLVAVYLIVIVPEIKGRTWGQMQFDLHVLNSRGNETIGVKQFWLRLLGQAITVFSLGFYPRKSENQSDSRTMADILSDTALMTVAHNDKTIGKRFVAVAVIVSSVLMGFQGVESTWLKDIYDQKPEARQLSPAQIKQRQDQEDRRDAALERMFLRRLERDCRKGDVSACEILKDFQNAK